MATIKLSGLDKTLGNIRALVKRFPNEGREQIKESTFAIDKNAKRAVPVDTGRLRSSARTEFSNNGLTGEESFNTDYADAVEFGTSKQSAQPYLGPAFREEAAQFENKLIARINKSLRRL